MATSVGTPFQGYGLGYTSAGRAKGDESQAALNLSAAQQNLARSADLQARWNLQQQQEAWDLKKKTAEASGKLAGDFLSAWTGAVGQTGAFYNQLISGITSQEGGLLSGAMGELNELTDYIGQEYETYKQTFGGTSEEFIGMARDEARMRRELGLELKDLSEADYEGVTGRAAADVGAQSEMARESDAREMMGLGIDPTSGKFGALTRRSYLDEAKNTAIAMNLARRGEKERISELKGMTMGMLDPTKTASVGLNLNAQGQNLLGLQGGLVKAGVDAKTSETKVLGDLASGYAQNVTKPFGEMAGYLVGKSGGLGLPDTIDMTPDQTGTFTAPDLSMSSFIDSRS